MDTYEKKYNDALERARVLHDGPTANVVTRTFLEQVFPELRESENEKVRKEIIEVLRFVPSSMWEQAKTNYERCFSYLEKQKEPVPIPDKFSGLKSLMLQYLQSAANRKDDTEIESDTDLWGRKILDYVWKQDEKQKDQKPAEKQDYSGLNDLERAIHRGFLAVGVANVPVGIIKETAKECLAQMKPAEWSEEDEKKRQRIIKVIEAADSDWVLQKAYGPYGDLIYWLKSLRPSWKPSEEQMEALNVLLCVGDFSYVGQATKLQELYTELKKLM